MTCTKRYQAMTQRTLIHRATLAAALVLATSACTGKTTTAGDIHGYDYDDRGDAVAAYVFVEWDDRDCAQYRLEPLAEDMAVVAAMFVWDGERFTTNQDRRKPGKTAK